MTKHDFTTGGYVVHGITGSHIGRVSAWFDEDGEILDAEQLTGRSVRRVKRGGPIWRMAQVRGMIWRTAQVTS